MATTTARPVPGSMFGVPGITRPLEAIENNDGTVTTLSQTNLTPVTGLIPFKQTDVIQGWLLRNVITNTVTPGSQTATPSPYFPDNFLGNIQLNFQNQFNTIQLESGIDLSIFNGYRPFRTTNYQNVNYQSPATSGYSAESNLLTSNSYTYSSGTINRVYWLPAGLQFDEFWNLAPDGTPMGAPIPMFVSPQFMAGTARIVQPSITFNSAFGSTCDVSPYTISGATTTPATFSGSNTMYVKRIGYYQPVDKNGTDSPPVANWQYTLKTQRQSLSGVSSVNLNVPLNGQVLSVYVRLFDPAAASNVGAPISTANVTNCNVVYGSNLYRYQDRPAEMQERFVAQHGYLPGQGIFIWDMAQGEHGRISNRYALNTMNTSGIQIQLTFTGTQSSSAYAVIGTEALTYVAVGN